MKDYQKALDSLSLGNYEEDPDSNEAKTKLLQELVDKEKPMKVVPFVNFWGYKGFQCPKCGKAINGGDYCPHCGQHLDWEGKK